MRLAEEITVVIAGEAIELRPSLRLALQLERRPGGFAKVLREIDDLTLGTMAELIEPHHGGGMSFLPDVFDAGLGNLRPALIAYVLSLAGVDPEQAEKAATSKGKTVPLGAHLLDSTALAPAGLAGPRKRRLTRPRRKSPRPSRADRTCSRRSSAASPTRPPTPAR